MNSPPQSSALPLVAGEAGLGPRGDTLSASRQTPALMTFVALTFAWTWGLLWVGATFTLQPPGLARRL